MSGLSWHMIVHHSVKCWTDGEWNLPWNLNRSMGWTWHVYDSIRVSRESHSSNNKEGDLQWKKANNPKASIFRRISMNQGSDFRNTSRSIRFNHELDSSRTDKSDLQSAKFDNPIMSIFRGMSWNRRDDRRNESDSIRVPRSLASNKMKDRNWQSLKHDSLGTAIIREIPISSGGVFGNWCHSTRFNRGWDSITISRIYWTSWANSAGIGVRVQPRTKFALVSLNLKVFSTE
jgi:hypothetical protein